MYAGWSLIELLVVIFIISTLSVFIFGSLSDVQVKARKILCTTNLKQWGLATHLYVNDHDGFLPTDGSSSGLSKNSGWYNALPPYVGLPKYSQWECRTNVNCKTRRSPFLCPSNKNKSNGKNLFHYCLNRHINGTGSGQFKRWDSLRSPAQYIWIFDNGKRAGVGSVGNLHKHIHDQSPNILALDGHVHANFSSRNKLDAEKKFPPAPLWGGSLRWIPD